MPTTAKDFQPFYDYSLLEVGLQSYFVGTGDFSKPPDDSVASKETWTPAANTTPFFTALQAAVFQENRPRVAIDINEITSASYQAQGIVDVNGQIRTVLWKAKLRFHVVTQASYAAHVALRKYVAALAAEIAPMIPVGVSSTVGVNHYLTYHLFTKVEDGGQDTSITPEDGDYHSTLDYNTLFAWRLDQIPGGYS